MCSGELGHGAWELKHRGFDDTTRHMLLPDNPLQTLDRLRREEAFARLHADTCRHMLDEDKAVGHFEIVTL